MGKTADVQQSIWADPWFQALSPDAKLLYLWAITTDHGNLAGLFVVGPPMIQFETGLTPSRFDKALVELQGKLIVKPESGVIWVVGRAKNVRSKTKQIAASIAKAVFDCPDESVRQAFLERYSYSKWLAEAFSERAQAAEASGWVSPANREAAFVRDGRKCVDCGSNENLTIDHIKPQIFGGTGELDNLATRCRSCNSRKGVALESQKFEPLQTSANLGEVPSQSQSQSQSPSSFPEQQNGEVPNRSEWGEWLEHYRQTTGRSSVQGSKPAREAFVARRKEGRSLDDLKFATVGCHGNTYNREHGHDVPETILRASKVERYIQLGRNGNAPAPDEHPADRRLRELAEEAA